MELHFINLSLYLQDLSLSFPRAFDTTWKVFRHFIVIKRGEKTQQFSFTLK